MKATRIQENKHSRSKFFFSQASHGLDQVLKLLHNKNNDRIIWVRAARSLLQAQKLAKEIELEEFQRAYHLYEEKIRHDLYLALTIYDQSTGRRQALPPQFFYGVADWNTGRTLDDTAIEVSNPLKAYRAVLDEVPPQPYLRPLAEESVVAIFDFLEYPKDYDDPLDDVQIWSTNWANIHDAGSGAAEVVESPLCNRSPSRQPPTRRARRCSFTHTVTLALWSPQTLSLAIKTP